VTSLIDVFEAAIQVTSVHLQAYMT